MKSSLILNLFLIVTAFGGCNGDSQDSYSYRIENNLNVDGRSRYYLMHLPPDYYHSTRDFPMVIFLHGTGGSAAQCERDYHFSDQADAGNFIVVYPEGVRNDGILGLRSWNAGYCCDYAANHNIDDVHFIEVLINQIAMNYKINKKRIYVTGISNGAMMAYRLACELSDKIAAIAPVSGTLLTKEPCQPARAVPVLHIHSTLDTKVPVTGGIGLAGYYFPPVDSALNVWVANDTCHVTPTVKDFGLYTLTQWTNNRNDTVINFYLTKDGGHAWPGGTQSRERADTPSEAIDADQIIWNFFQKYQLP